MGELVISNNSYFNTNNILYCQQDQKFQYYEFGKYTRAIYMIYAFIYMKKEMLEIFDLQITIFSYIFVDFGPDTFVVN